MVDLNFSDIEKYLPAYLSNISKNYLGNYIKNNFPRSSDPNYVYSNSLKDRFYQGDVIFELINPILNIEEGKFEIEYRDGILFSNSCNAEKENSRLIELSLNFAQIIPLKELLEFLRNKNFSEERISNFERDVKSNSFNYFFYLPELSENGKVVIEESLVRFDRIITIPMKFFYEKYSKSYKPEGDKIISLSQYGFWFFLFKISFYFSRMNEDIERGYLG